MGIRVPKTSQGLYRLRFIHVVDGKILKIVDDGEVAATHDLIPDQQIGTSRLLAPSICLVASARTGASDHG